MFLKPFCLSYCIEFYITRNASKFVKIICKPNIIIVEAHACARAHVMKKYVCDIVFGMIIKR